MVLQDFIIVAVAVAVAGQRIRLGFKLTIHYLNFIYQFYLISTYPWLGRLVTGTAMAGLLKSEANQTPHDLFHLTQRYYGLSYPHFFLYFPTLPLI